jgi:NADPH:quinone reductase-like Zn-dependent oxidoreductase
MRAAVYDRLGSAELARAAGADAVVDYRAEDAASAVRAAAPDGVDRIVEVALGANLDLRVLAQNGTVVTYAQTGPDPAIPIRRLMRRNLTLRTAEAHRAVEDGATGKVVVEL